MPGKDITQRQETLYMQSRQSGLIQETSAAKAEVSVRSGRRIETGKIRAKEPRHRLTRSDPFAPICDPYSVLLLYWKLMGAKGSGIGMKKMLDRLKKAIPQIQYGYFNRTKEIFYPLGYETDWPLPAIL